MEFLRVNAHGDREFTAWFEVLQRSEIEREEGRREGWRPEEWRARALDESAAIYYELYGYGPDAAHPVAVGALQVTRDDNLAWMRADLFVDPPERRRGYGTALLGHLETTARRHQRDALVFWVQEGAHQVGQSPSRAFAPRRGYYVSEEGARRDLAWPRPEGEREALDARWSPHAKGYDVLSWSGAAPEAMLEGLAHLTAIMPIEVPGDAVPYEKKHVDATSVREHERRVDEMGRDLLVAVARHRVSGELVGFSELTVSRAQPSTAYQWDTLVVRAHRGHRLGGLMKLATLALLDEGHYATKVISTFNNKVNQPMIAVNEELGARPAGGIVAWRKDFSASAT